MNVHEVSRDEPDGSHIPRIHAVPAAPVTHHLERVIKAALQLHSLTIAADSGNAVARFTHRLLHVIHHIAARLHVFDVAPHYHVSILNPLDTLFHTFTHRNHATRAGTTGCQDHTTHLTVHHMGRLTRQVWTKERKLTHLVVDGRVWRTSCGL